MSKVQEFKDYVTAEKITGISGFQLGDKGRFHGTWDDFLESTSKFMKQTTEETAEMYLNIFQAEHLRVIGECEKCSAMLVEDREHDCEESRKRSEEVTKLAEDHFTDILDAGAEALGTK